MMVGAYVFAYTVQPGTRVQLDDGTRMDVVNVASSPGHAMLRGSTGQPVHLRSDALVKVIGHFTPTPLKSSPSP